MDARFQLDQVARHLEGRAEPLPPQKSALDAIVIEIDRIDTALAAQPDIDPAGLEAARAAFDAAIGAAARALVPAAATEQDHA